MKTPGLIQDSFDPRDIWLDEIVGASEEPIPEEYKIEGLKFEPQGYWPFCVSFSVTKMIEEAIHRQSGVRQEFSQPHLFIDSGGGKNGSSFRSNLNRAKGFGVCSYALCPMPDDLYNTKDEKWNEIKTMVQNTPLNSAYKILGYVRVQNDPDALKRAILGNGPIMVGVYANNTSYWKPDHNRLIKNSGDNHATLLVGWDKEHWILFDSLKPSRDWSNGYHTISKDYNFNSAYAITEIPQEQKEEIKVKRLKYERCLNHYGQVGDHELEVRTGLKILDAFRKNKNESVLAAAGRFWPQLINAVAYGGYSAEYTKWGIWHPGDIINFVYAWKTTGEEIFDLDKLRSEHK